MAIEKLLKLIGNNMMTNVLFDSAFNCHLNVFQTQNTFEIWICYMMSESQVQMYPDSTSVKNLGSCWIRAGMPYEAYFSVLKENNRIYSLLQPFAFLWHFITMFVSFFYCEAVLKNLNV